MAEHDKRDTRIIGRDADAAKDAAQADQLSQTTSESAGGNLTGTGVPDADTDFDIVFEREDIEESRH